MSSEIITEIEKTAEPITPEQTDDILFGATEKMSEVSPEIAVKDLVAEKAAAKSAALPLQKESQIFDEKIHAKNPDGSPKYKPDGSYAHKRGRKLGQHNAVKDFSVQKPALNLPHNQQPINGGISPAEKIQINPEDEQVKNAAEVSALSFYTIGTLALGDEWQPDGGLNGSEHKNNTNVLYQYYKTKNIKDIPPSFALIICALGYSLKRFSKPSTKTRLKMFFLWANDKIKGFFKRKKAV